jgi:dienelactone hydrolase
VQEFALFEAVGPLLPSTQRPACARLMAAWHARRMAQFDEAMRILAAPIARAAVDREALPPISVRDKVVRAVGLARESERSPEAIAMGRLAERLEAGLQTATQELIAIHGLTGTAAAEALARVASAMRTDAPVDEGKAALMGGVVSGALTGLAADPVRRLASAAVWSPALCSARSVRASPGPNMIRAGTRRCLLTTCSSTNGVRATLLAIAHYAAARRHAYTLISGAHSWLQFTAQHAALEIWDRGTEGCGLPHGRSCSRRPRSSLDELYPDTIRHCPQVS